MELDKYQQQCLDKLIWSTKQLDVKIEHTELAKIAEIIVETMTGPWRYFHTPAHIFEVGGEENAIEVLAALFHDLVYVQVDHSINLNLTYYIAPYIKERRSELFIREKAELPNDVMFEIVITIFGFIPGQLLSPLLGQNEFLSALAAAKILEPFFTKTILAQIVVCIEATIPFRDKINGLTSSEVLQQRLEETNIKFNLGFTASEIEETIHKSVKMSNRDVGGFALENSAHFLDNTWSLLPETNHHLHHSNSYTIQQYRIALTKMEGFLNFLTPELIFRKFKGEPDVATYQSMLARGQKNLAVGRLYLKCKIVAIALLEALSWRFGKNVPLAAMMGELPSLDFSLSRLVDFLPPTPPEYYPPKNPLEEEVLHLLEVGRTQNFTYDLKESPLATLIVKTLGFDKVEQLRQQANDFFEGKLSGEELLKLYNHDLLGTITTAIAQLMDQRKQALCKYNCK